MPRKQDLISKRRFELRNPYAYLDGDGGYDAEIPEKLRDVRDEGDQPSIHTELSSLIRMAKSRKLRQRSGAHASMESIARELQRILWNHREEAFGRQGTSDPRTVLDPRKALMLLGFEVDLVESLGWYNFDGIPVEIAGTIDRRNRTVAISSRYNSETQRFTCAHELGHALLHEKISMHRDRPIDGSAKSAPKVFEEVEADQFAVQFLMPRKLLKIAFRSTFGGDCFTLDLDNLFALSPGKEHYLLSKIKVTRDLSRTVAQATRFNGLQFQSLAEQFGVSKEAMAIRLEELNLVEKI